MSMLLHVEEEPDLATRCGLGIPMAGSSEWDATPDTVLLNKKVPWKIASLDRMSATHFLGASLSGTSKAITIGERHIRRPTAARCRSMMPKNNNIKVESAVSDLQTASEPWKKHVLLFAKICPLAYMFPTTAQAAAQASAGLAEDFTVPLLLTTLLAGVVFGAFNDKGTRRILEEQVSGIRRVSTPSTLVICRASVHENARLLMRPSCQSL